MTTEIPYGFTVYRHPAGRYTTGDFAGRTWPEDWRVYLPHSCDEWVIGEGTRAEAITQLEAFIAEASRALEALRAGQVHNSKPIDKAWLRERGIVFDEDD